MGCDTKGLVMTKEKNPFKIFGTIKKSLEGMMLEKTGCERLFDTYRKDGFSGISCELTDISGMLIVSFEYAGEKRDLHVHLDCDNDGKNCGYLNGKKIILSFGMWGSSIELMKGIVQGLKVFGDGYLIENDCGIYQIENCKV